MKQEKRWWIYALAAFGAAWALNTAVECAVLPAKAAYLLLGLGWGACAADAFRQRSERAFLRLTVVSGLCAAMLFVIRFPYVYAWHDVAAYVPGTAGTEQGNHHMGYVLWLMEKGSLPLVNPLEADYSIFAHPPVFYLLAALFLKLNLLLQLPLAAALENLQVLNMAFAVAGWMTIAQILRDFGFRGRRLCASVLAAAAQPMFYMLGCALNNDSLSVLCILQCLLWVLRWCRNRKMAELLLTGLWLGGGMAVKYTVALLIPALGVLFAVVFFRELCRWKKNVQQYGIFLLSSVPLGIAWPLYQLMAWNVPLGFVRTVDAPSLIGLTLLQRYGLPGAEALGQLFFRNDAATDHNLWFQLLKTALFDEKTLFRTQNLLWLLSYAALVLYAVWMGWAAWRGLRLAAGKSSITGMPRLLLSVYAATLVLYFVKFTLDMPFVCSINFRYMMTLLLPLIVAWTDGCTTRPKISLALAWPALTAAAYSLYFAGFGTL